MNKLVAVGVAAIGGAIAFRALPPEMRARLTDAAKRWLGQRMEGIMLSLPENSPPKLVASLLPRLQAQNDQIIAMLQEQNELLREKRQPPPR